LHKPSRVDIAVRNTEDISEYVISIECAIQNGSACLKKANGQCCFICCFFTLLTLGVGLQFIATPDTMYVTSEPITWLILAIKTVQENTQTKYNLKTANNEKNPQNESTLVQSHLTTLGQETRWVYSTTLVSPHGASFLTSRTTVVNDAEYWYVAYQSFALLMMWLLSLQHNSHTFKQSLINTIVSTYVEV